MNPIAIITETTQNIQVNNSAVEIYATGCGFQGGLGTLAVSDLEERVPLTSGFCAVWQVFSCIFSLSFSPACRDPC